MHNGLTFLGLARKDMGRNVALHALGFEQLQHLNELAENKDLLSFFQQRFQQFEKCLCLSRNRVVPHQPRMTADLPQARQDDAAQDRSLI
ncbi:MAG TPA: hypothetical protein PKW90_17930, partial [Myxococcota bacterium]|nr:hypothetical protein [Myxococcota bacterium]